jgi:hypothetical protein
MKYSVIYKLNKKSNRKEIIIRSSDGGKYKSVHTDYKLLDDEGKTISINNIDDKVAKFIIDNFDQRGDTLSFEIFKSDLNNGKVLNRKIIEKSPEDVRHSLTSEENNYTSTGEKLSAHWPIFEKYKNTDHGSIIRATMTLHQLCSSHCQYCSTIGRNRTDSISLEEAKDFVIKLYSDQAEYNKKHFLEYNKKYKALTGTDIRLKGLILSGGGQPNLWPYFTEFVEWLSDLDIELGLITNGFPKNVPDDIYKKFKWIRISITPEDASPHYKNGKFNLQPIPKTIKNNKEITVGYSYVYGVWTDKDILIRIKNSLNENGFDYARMLTDCNLSRSSQLEAHKELAEVLFSLNLIDEHGNPTGKIFHQLKFHGTSEEANSLFNEGQCYLQIYNVFWDTAGHEKNKHSYCYTCDSITVLSDEIDNNYRFSERKFNYKIWGTKKNTNVEELYTKKIKKYFDPRKECASCLFMKNNTVVKDLISMDDYDSIKIDSNIEHVNFP